MRVLFLTIEALESREGEPYSKTASTRWGAIYPARWLAARGHQTRVLSLSDEPYATVRDAVREADRVVLGKFFRMPEDTGPFQVQVDYFLRLFADRGDPRPFAIPVLGDDVFESPHFHRFAREAEPWISVWYAASGEIRARLAALSARPVEEVPECYEMSRNDPVAPRKPAFSRLRRLFARAGASAEAGRLRMVWFGHDSNIQGLRQSLTDLYEFGKEVPLFLRCLGPAGFGMEALAALPEVTAPHAPLRMVFEPWTLAGCDAALRDGELVLIPYDLSDRTKTVKSNNRLIASLRAGRLALASPIPAMKSLEQFAWVGHPLSAGLRWALDHPEAVLARVAEGQRYVEAHHSPEAITGHWERLLAD